MSGHVDYVISTMYKWWFQCSCRLCQDSDHVQMVVLMFLSKEYTQKVGSTTSIGIIAFDLATRVKRVCRWTSEELCDRTTKSKGPVRPTMFERVQGVSLIH
ncbi:hypothetical protein AAZV13_04G123000 [Glycine max]